ncbi:hypothetical protein MTP04_17820 [Lysinibacillus sp. PLM2]|nr:hypothetical protein MTP04_17820 [Lysinibacillus sp. PLM2]
MNTENSTIFHHLIQSSRDLERATLRYFHAAIDLIKIQINNECDEEVGKRIHNLLNKVNELQKYYNEKLLLLSECVPEDDHFQFCHEKEFKQMISILNNLSDELVLLNRYEFYLEFEIDMAEYLLKKRMEIFSSRKFDNDLSKVWLYDFGG